MGRPDGWPQGLVSPRQESDLVFFPRVEVDLNVHEPHLNNYQATMADWDTAPLLHLAKPEGLHDRNQTSCPHFRAPASRSLDPTSRWMFCMRLPAQMHACSCGLLACRNTSSGAASDCAGESDWSGQQLISYNVMYCTIIQYNIAQYTMTLLC